MTDGLNIPNSDLVVASPKAITSAAAASPQAAAATLSNSAHRPSSLVPKTAGLAPAGLASVSSVAIADIDPELKAAIAALELSWLRACIVMNAITLRVAAASEIQPSVSTTSIPTT